MRVNRPSPHRSGLARARCCLSPSVPDFPKIPRSSSRLVEADAVQFRGVGSRSFAAPPPAIQLPWIGLHSLGSHLTSIVICITRCTCTRNNFKGEIVVSVTYRAIWQHPDVDPDIYMETARERFSHWASDDPHSDVLSDGIHSLSRKDDDGGVHTAAVSTLPLPTADGNSGCAMELVHHKETDTEDACLWTTRVRLVPHEDGIAVWVENTVETDDVTRHYSVGRPRIVSDLLTISGKPVIGSVRVPVDPVEITRDEVGELVAALRGDSRTFPLVVVTEPPPAVDSGWRHRAKQIASRCQGVALIVILDAPAMAAFKLEMGDLGVWDGAIRVYAPTPVTPATSLRHRYTTSRMLVARGPGMVSKIVYDVTQMSTRTRVPDCFTPFTTAGAAAQISATDWEAAIAAEQNRAFEAVVEADEAERELARLSGHMQRLRETLAAENRLDLFYGTQHDAQDGAPDTVEDTSEALVSAQAYLDAWLVVPDAAARELDGINTAVTSGAWGNKTWRGFRALAAYAQAVREEDFSGNLWEWCENSGDPRAWPASSKHLSMTESDSVQKNSKFARSRRLPVDERVDPSGRVQMLAHLKISEGGGDLAPRVYFFDDTRGKTGKIHIGFVGPHYLMPNTKS